MRQWLQRFWKRIALSDSAVPALTLCLTTGVMLAWAIFKLRVH
jgi:hypothetical protein